MTSKMDVGRILDRRADKNSGDTFILFETVSMPTDYGELLKKLDPKSLGDLREYRGSGQARFQKWEKGWRIL